MWSDNDIDEAFQRLNPPDPEPVSFPLDAWLRLETQLDKAVIAQAVRQKLWRYFAAEVAVVALVAAGWLLWPTRAAAPEGTIAATAATKEAPRALAASGSVKKPGLSATNLTALATTPPAPAAMGRRPAAPVATAVAPALSVAVPNSSRFLATVAPDAPRRQARKGFSQEGKLAVHNGLAAGTATPSASRKLLRKIKERRPDSPPKAGAQANSSPTTAVATSAQAASVRTELAAAQSSFIASTPSYTRVSSVDAPVGLQRNATKGLTPTEETAVGQVPTRASPTKASGIEAESASQGASLTALALRPVALALRPVALAASAVPELPVPLGAGALVSLPNQAPLPAPVHQPRFYLGVVGAPDVSTVKFASVQSPLLNFGVTLEYRLTNRLRLTTGLLRSTKQYTARREDYTWGTSRQASLYDFKQVDATCQVLDVPLNLRYDLLTQPRYKVFGSVGLSSFFMQRERYSYPYLYQNKPYYAEWTLVNANRHLFSIVNLSFGYERSLSNHWSLQAEPYLKLPLGGVGAGRVQLVSGGIFVGAKYGF